MILCLDQTRERFFNNRKISPLRLNYRFLVMTLAAMMFAAILPALPAHAVSVPANSDAVKLLQDCIQQFQGADHIWCDNYYTSNVYQSSAISKNALSSSYYRYGGVNSIVVNEQTKVTLSGLRSSDPDQDSLVYSWSQVSGDPVTFSPSASAGIISFVAPPVPPHEVRTVVLSLTVDDGHNAKDTTTFNVIVLHVNHPPVVKVGPDQVVDEGTQVTLTGSATDADNDPLTYTWGQYSGPEVELSSTTDTTTSFVSPTITPGSTKPMLFILTADDGHGGRASALVKVTVKSTHTTPTVTCSDISVNENTLVRLSAAVSNPSNDDLSFYWRQISGQPVKLTGADSLNPTFMAPSISAPSGTLRFQLDVTDPIIDVPSCQVDVRINQVQLTGQAPVADAGPDQDVTQHTLVSLDGSASTGDNIKYSWTQTGGDQVTLLFKNTVHPAFFAPDVPIGQAKTFEFKLTVSNAFGQSSDTVTITVHHDNNAPTARIVPVP